MKKVRITVLRKMLNADLAEEYGTSADPCGQFEEGQVIITDGNQPDGMCPMAWDVLRPYVFALSHGADEPFYAGEWMKDSGVAVVSCSNGLRPVVFKLEAIQDEDEESKEDQSQTFVGDVYDSSEQEDVAEEFADAAETENSFSDVIEKAITEAAATAAVAATTEEEAVDAAAEGDFSSAEIAVECDDFVSAKASEEWDDSAMQEMDSWNDSRAEDEETSEFGDTDESYAEYGEGKPDEEIKYDSLTKELIASISEDMNMSVLMNCFEERDEDGFRFDRIVERYGHSIGREVNGQNEEIRYHLVIERCKGQPVMHSITMEEFKKDSWPVRNWAQELLADEVIDLFLDSKEYVEFPVPYRLRVENSSNQTGSETADYIVSGAYVSSGWSSAYNSKGRHEGLNEVFTVLEEDLEDLPSDSVGKIECHTDDLDGIFDLIPYYGEFKSHVDMEADTCVIHTKSGNRCKVIRLGDLPMLFIEESVLKMNRKQIPWYEED